MSNTLIRVEYAIKPSKTVRVHRCKHEGCEQEVRVRDDNKIHSGMCKGHSHVKRPFESIYNSLHNDWRGTEVLLTYEEFLEFTCIDKCIYCYAHINRTPYSICDGKYNSRAYFLDRKDHLKGYSKENCVVCCTSCNKIRSNLLTHDEMIVAMKAVLEYRKSKA